MFVYIISHLQVFSLPALDKSKYMYFQETQIIYYIFRSQLQSPTSNTPKEGEIKNK